MIFFHKESKSNFFFGGGSGGGGGDRWMDSGAVQKQFAPSTSSKLGA